MHYVHSRIHSASIFAGRKYNFIIKQKREPTLTEFVPVNYSKTVVFGSSKLLLL